MTSKKLIKEIEKKSPTLIGIRHNGRQHTYYNNLKVLEFIETEGGLVTGGVYIRSKNNHDDVQSDYFAGSFYHTIKSAVEQFNQN